MKLTPDDFKDIVMLHWLGIIDKKKCRQMIEDNII